MSWLALGLLIYLTSSREEENFLGSKSNFPASSQAIISSIVAAIAPLQSASRGRIEKGSSIWIPISSMPKRKKAITSVAGTVAQWFHELPMTGQRAKGKRTVKTDKKRAVWRVYTRGMGDLKIRSLAPVRSTSVVIDESIRARSMGFRSASRMLADMALKQNMGRLLAAMHASACAASITPLSTSSYSSFLRTSSFVGPRRKLRRAFAYAAVLAARRPLRALLRGSSGK
mmetsp:Transcript_23257/g.34791  ORF Transcript_23257/g.34791 Transcript_23257/m.34791 type:complete len:229 (-) Transcript_23257:393-1079(-)